MKRVGIALGGGGARGMAHIPVIEALDRLEIRPTEIAGTSMGAIIGAMYASGLRGKDIRGLVDDDMYRKSDNFRSKLTKAFEFMKLLDFIQVETFEELRIPLKVVTTDFWTGEKFVISSGPLLPAIKASMSIPGIFPQTGDCRG